MWVVGSRGRVWRRRPLAARAIFLNGGRASSESSSETVAMMTRSVMALAETNFSFSAFFFTCTERYI